MEINQTKKRQIFFDYFPNYGEVEEWLNDKRTEYPSTTQDFQVGYTAYDGIPIRGIRIYKGGSSKPIVFLQGGIHAREWITVTTALYCVQELLELSVSDQPSVLDVFDFYVVPVFNIDGYSYSHSNERLWRKNRQTNTGSSCRGVDLNRNYPYQWRRGGTSDDPCSDIFLGRAAGDTSEVSGITSYLRSLNRVVFFLDIHCYGAMFMSPYGWTYTLPPSTDYNQMYSIMQIAQSGIRSVNGRSYAIGSSANVIYIASGGSDDWCYGVNGVIPSFTVEIYGTSFVTPTSQILPLGQEIWQGVLAVSEGLSKRQ